MRLSDSIIDPPAGEHIHVSAKRASLLVALRLLIALLLLVMLNLQWLNQPTPHQHPELALITLMIYAMANTGLLTVILCTHLRPQGLLLFCLALLDILCLNLLMQANASHSSQLSLLFILAIMGSASVLPARLSLLIAAMAALSVLLQGLSRIIYQSASTNDLIAAGTLGIIFFIAAFAVQGLFYRAIRHEMLARRQAEDIMELRELTESIVRQMRTGLLVVDQQGHIQLINEAARALLELRDDPGILVGQRVPPALITTWQHWSANPQQLPPSFRCNPSGSNVQASFTPLLSRSNTQTLVFLEDTRLITQQAQAMKLASLGRLTGSIAHEIRNPLGAISHAAQLLDEAEALPAQDQQLCAIIKAQSQRVNQVIENVLALSRRAPTEARLLNLDEQLRRFIASYHSSQYPQASIDYRTESSDLMIRFDASQLEQVLTNLFDNGLRHSAQATGQAELTISCYQGSDDLLPRLDVIDHGTGVADADVAEIFEPFYTTENDGTGLGLYLSREICEAHQTRLCYLKTAHQQSCFRLIFAHPKKRWLA